MRTLRSSILTLLLALSSMVVCDSAFAQVYNFRCEALTHLKGQSEASPSNPGSTYSDGECGANLPAGTPQKGSTADQDNTYLDLCINKKEVQGTRPQNCMAHKSTRTKSPFDFNPWYLISVQQPRYTNTAYKPPLGYKQFPDPNRPDDDQGWCEGNLQPYCVNYPPESLTNTARHPYLGNLYRGATNTDVYSNRLSQIDPADTVNSCIPMILPTSGTPDPYDPFWMRAEIDNCANQYILTRARYARRAFEQQGALPLVGDKAENLCQPLRLIPINDKDQEYIPSDYIYGAWRKLLVDANYRMRDYGSTFVSSNPEPQYSKIGVKIYSPNAIYPPRQGSTPFRCGQKSNEPFGNICINGLVEQQVERIFDPSHPFSPRWDFTYNDRDFYSLFTIPYGGDPLNQVRCAGNADDKIIKVDIMSFRASKFHWKVFRKILVNIVCYYLRILRWWCWRDMGCQRNTSGGRSGSNSSGQCCATNWGGRDVGGRLGGIICGRNTMETICKDIRKNIVPINTLKMRKATLHNFPRGVPEGYRFTDYFGSHLPYLRCWDTGKECVTGDTEADPMKIAGSKVAIVGVGRETQSCRIGGGKGLKSSRTSVNFEGRVDYRLLLEAWIDLASGSADAGMVQDIYDAATLKKRMKEAEPITSWSELKLYQARSARETGLNCLAKHELVFKQGTGEDIVLGRAGAQYTRLICDKDGGNEQCSSTNVLRMNREITMPWPMGWRGYASDPTENKRFPNAGTGVGGFNLGEKLSNWINNDLVGDIDTGERAPAASLIGDHEGGLDYALVGDIIIYDEDVTGARNPYLAYVTETSNLTAGSPNKLDWVKAIGFNHGKFLDACGNSDTWGKGEEYTMYKNDLPPDIKDGLAAVGYHTKSCDDPRLSACIENLWSDVKLYFPGQDYRGLSANAVLQVVDDMIN